MANILLFGASGFLGKAVIRELLKNNHHLTTISRSVDLSNTGKFNLEITQVEADPDKGLTFDKINFRAAKSNR